MCVLDPWSSCHFHQSANRRDLYLLLDPVPDSTQATNMENRIFCDLNPSLRRVSKLVQKMKCPRFCRKIPLPAVASRLLLPTVRGSLHQTLSWGHPLVGEVDGS